MSDETKSERIQLHPRELAEIAEMSKKHQTNKAKFIWEGDRTGYLACPAPQWALDWLRDYRTSQSPKVQVDCPRCPARVGEWCHLGGTPKKNFVHDTRTFLAHEARTGETIRPKPKA